MRYIKNLVRFFLPHGFFLIRDKYLQKRKNLHRRSRMLKYEELDTHKFQYSYSDSIDFLLKYNLVENEIRAGSIPEKDLIFITEKIILDSSKPLITLHIGNFVGVSLSFLVDYVKQIHVDSLIFCIDPNIEHRGILNPNFYVKSLVERYGFCENVVLIDGFSLAKNLKNDGGSLYSIDYEITNELGSSQSLLNLTKISSKNFDIAIIDGNHSYDYLKEEIELTKMILKDGGYLILDDINDSWPEIKKIFLEINKYSTELKLIAQNGRIGIFRKIVE